MTIALRGERLILRPGRAGDHASLRAVLQSPGVARWWGPVSEAELDERVAGGDEETTVLMIELDGELIGLVQFHEETDPMYRHAGIDIAIGDPHQGQGLGPEAIGLVIDHLASLGHHRLVIDPNAANRRAIEVYERVGFRAVGTMRAYEWSATEGRWTDGLLMELLLDDRAAGPAAPDRAGDM